MRCSRSGFRRCWFERRCGTRGITGKRKEGYKEAILAAKSAVKSFFELIGKEEQSSCVSNPKGADNGPLEV